MTQPGQFHGGYLQAGLVSVLGMGEETLVCHIFGLCKRLSLLRLPADQITCYLDKDGFIKPQKQGELINEAVILQTLHPVTGVWIRAIGTDMATAYAE